MAQRAFRIEDIDLIMMIATEVEDGYIVREKDCQAVERELKRQLDRIRRLKGKRLVVQDGAVVTAYHAARDTERRLLRDVAEGNLSEPGGQSRLPAR
jgi:hypothetical protein